MIMNLGFSLSFAFSVISFAFRIEDSFLSSNQFRRIIVISDIHGDSRALQESLYLGYQEIVGANSAVDRKEFSARFQNASALASNPQPPLYTGGDVALIQMGDMIDRGTHSLECLRLMNVTEAVIGFKTITLLGNHELLAMLQDPLYHKQHNPRDDLKRDDPSLFNRTIDGPMWRHFRNSFMPMVRWGPPARSNVAETILDLNSSATLFVHAGMTEEFLYRFNIVSPPPPTFVSKYPMSALKQSSSLSDGTTTVSVFSFNSMVERDFILLPNPDLFQKYAINWSPITVRNFGKFDIDCDSIDRILRLFDVSRIVIGHVSSGHHQVRTNCDGKILLTDIGASRYMRGFDMDQFAPTPGIVIMTTAENHQSTAATDGSSLSTISAVYRNLVSRVITHEPIWEHNSQQIQSLNRWAKNETEAYVRVPPSFDGQPRLSLYH